MNTQPVLRIHGEVQQPRELSHADLAQLDGQIPDVRTLDPQRQGKAVPLASLLELVGVRDTARFLGLHASSDDFHASIPLSPVRDRACLIYEVDGQPLAAGKGGPFRFFIPDHAACHTDEIDECANVKFVDEIELTAEKGFDNRPQDDDEHARLHDH